MLSLGSQLSVTNYSDYEVGLPSVLITRQLNNYKKIPILNEDPQ